MSTISRRRLLVTGSAFVGAGAFPSALRAQQLRQINFITPLNYLIGYAPSLNAQAGGHFTKEGLDVTILPGKGSAVAVQQVIAGRALYGRGDPLAMAKAIGQGAPIIAFATISHRSPIMVYSSPKNRLRADLRIPRDLSVVGFDDIPPASWLSPPLTTVRQPLDDMAATAVGMVLDLARGERRATTRSCSPRSSSCAAAPRHPHRDHDLRQMEEQHRPGPAGLAPINPLTPRSVRRQTPAHDLNPGRPAPRRRALIRVPAGLTACPAGGDRPPHSDPILSPWTRSSLSWKSPGWRRFGSVSPSSVGCARRAPVCSPRLPALTDLASLIPAVTAVAFAALIGRVECIAAGRPRRDGGDRAHRYILILLIGHAVETVREPLGLSR